MTATAHALVAGAIAHAVPEPITASTLALISHFIMDCVPHWDFGTNWRKRNKWTTGAIAITDTLFGIGLSIVLFSNTTPMIALIPAIVASLLPDWLESPWYIFFATPQKTEPGKNAGFIERTLYGIYRVENTLHTKAQYPFGLITQVVTVAFFLILTRAFA